MAHLLNPSGKRLTPTELFEDYVSVRENDRRDPLSREASVPYRYIWKAWCDWLAEDRACADPYLYLVATSTDMHRYLRVGPSPASKRKSRSGPTTPITRQRYGRVLRDIYTHAVNFGYADHHPVSEAAIGVAPTQTERSGQVLPPGVFEAITQVLPSDPTPYEMRDNAIMWLLVDCAMTSGEIRELKLDDITMNRLDPGQYLLRLDGPRAAQDRVVETRGVTGHALHRWLTHRKVMRRTTDVVFISEKKGAMTRRALFGLVSKVTMQACDLLKVPYPNHVGPATIRNTAIVRWYNSGSSVSSICKRTGIKDERTLLFRLKIHLVDRARANSTE